MGVRGSKQPERKKKQCLTRACSEAMANDEGGVRRWGWCNVCRATLPLALQRCEKTWGGGGEGDDPARKLRGAVW